MLFEPFTLKGVTFKNRIVRSSMGGRSAFYDGTVSPAWRNFERRFAEGGIAAIISATFTVDDRRWAPLEYPKISQDRFIGPIAEGVRAVHDHDCRYILQIGDAGGHTQTSLFSQPEDSKSASRTFDLLYGYRNTSSAMSVSEIHATTEKFAAGARRARQAGCDGVEVTASKGYILHQFLNPATNRRQDDYGGDPERRFRFVEEVVRAVRREVGSEFLFGVRLSAADFNYLPINLRLPLRFPLRDYFLGNGIERNLTYGKRLKELGVDYLHIDSGFGFINPRGNPGTYPLEEVRLFANSTRHLTGKAAVRAALLNSLPAFLLRRVLGIGWKLRPAANADFAKRFRAEVGLPVIANGGFQARSLIERALAEEKCDLVAMARPLLANRDLVRVFRDGRDLPEKPCTSCNRCCVRTAVFPLGCYDPSRFESQEAMEKEILAWSGDPATAEEQRARIEA